jgi:hypothetical protein
MVLIFVFRRTHWAFSGQTKLGSSGLGEVQQAPNRNGISAECAANQRKETER